MKDIYPTQKYYAMLNYFFNKLKEINENTHGKINHNDSEFTFKGFCIICHHFKDNLKNNGNNCVEEYINKSNFLSACVDISNGTKHSEDINDRSNKDITNGNSHTYIDFGVNGAYTSNKFIIKIDGRDYDSIEFAQKCSEVLRRMGRIYKKNNINF